MNFQEYSPPKVFLFHAFHIAHEFHSSTFSQFWRRNLYRRNYNISQPFPATLLLPTTALHKQTNCRQLLLRYTRDHQYTAATVNFVDLVVLSVCVCVLLAIPPWNDRRWKGWALQFKHPKIWYSVFSAAPTFFSLFSFSDPISDSFVGQQLTPTPRVDTFHI